MRFWQNNKVWCVRLWHFDTSINVKQSSKPSVHHDQTIPAHELCLSQTVRKKVVGALHQHRQAMVVLTWQRRKTTTAERWSRWHWHRPTRARPPPPPTCAPTTSTSSATASSHIETTLRWIPASAVQLSISHQAGDSGQMASCFLEWARRAPQHAFHVHWSRIRGDWTMPFFYRRRQPADRWRVFFLNWYGSSNMSWNLELSMPSASRPVGCAHETRRFLRFIENLSWLWLSICLLPAFLHNKYTLTN